MTTRVEGLQQGRNGTAGRGISGVYAYNTAETAERQTDTLCTLITRKKKSVGVATETDIPQVYFFCVCDLQVCLYNVMQPLHPNQCARQFSTGEEKELSIVVKS